MCGFVLGLCCGVVWCLFGFFEDDVGDVFSGIDFGQGMCGIGYLYVLGRIFG